MIFWPPRHGKSEFTSKYFPAWFEGRFPDKRVILTSYEADFASQWGGKVRDLLEDHGENIFGVEISQDSSAKDRWNIKGKEGGMQTAGVGGPITGKGADVLIIDDPIKNDKEAASKTTREAHKTWYQSTAYTRLEPGGSIIIIMTRWHEDDLAGWLLKEEKEAIKQGLEPEGWEVLRLPAIAEENDILGREVGRALFPERYDEKALEKIKRAVGSYFWSAMYQQRPQPDGGSIFKRSYFHYFTDDGEYYTLYRAEGGNKRYLKTACWIFQTCDAAATEKEKSDYFVNSTWAVTPESDLLLLDVFREKAETTKHLQVMQDQLTRWSPTFQGVENKTYGLNIIQTCIQKGYPIKELKADTDKVSRARPMSARYENGAVYHRQGAPWLSDYEDELIAFPNGEHDDQVDTASYAGIVLIENITGDAIPQGLSAGTSYWRSS
jgi:predicted phage terminase large subunit-like protein